MKKKTALISLTMFFILSAFTVYLFYKVLPCPIDIPGNKPGTPCEVLKISHTADR